MVLVSGKLYLLSRRATLALPFQIVAVVALQNVTKLSQLLDQRLNAVRLLYFKGMQTGKSKGNVQKGTSHRKGLGQIGLLGKIMSESSGPLSGIGQLQTLVREFVLHAQRLKQAGHGGVALPTVTIEPFQHQVRPFAGQG